MAASGRLMVALPSTITLACPVCGADLDVPLQLGPIVDGTTVLSGDVGTARAHLRDHVDRQEEQMGRKPALGDTVHYQSYGTPGGEHAPTCRTAIVTEVGQWVTTTKTPAKDGTTRTLLQTWEPEAVALTVLNPRGPFFDAECQHSEGARRGGTWHWPEDAENATPGLVVHLDMVADATGLQAALTRATKTMSSRTAERRT
ncbi:hypothetical protein [Streptomyces sp. NPDC050738]|uniref:hypothetical protein n=1 Tax=Streptomyces sp. NPDC050738 TaxID=3154744 RepID=UPI00342BDDE1